MAWTEALKLLLDIFSRSGGPEQLRKFFTNHKDELLELRAALKRPPKPTGY
jgi:hypothetical protein